MESEYAAEWPMPEAWEAAEFLNKQQSKVAGLVDHCQYKETLGAQGGYTL